MQLAISHFKPLCYRQVFSPIKTPNSSSSSSSMKNFKTALYNPVVAHLRRISRAVSEVKYKLVEKLKEMALTDYFKQSLTLMKKWNKKGSRYQVKICDSFRFHYNWGNSFRVLPLPVAIEPALARFDPATNLFHYGSMRYSNISTLEERISTSDNNTTTGAGGGAPESSSHLSAYLYWLEQNNVFDDGNNNNSTATEGQKDNIDELAENFIASCHEKFRLEKEESYRMFQEMMARSL